MRFEKAMRLKFQCLGAVGSRDTGWDLSLPVHLQVVVEICWDLLNLIYHCGHVAWNCWDGFTSSICVRVTCTVWHGCGICRPPSRSQTCDRRLSLSCLMVTPSPRISQWSQSHLIWTSPEKKHRGFLYGPFGKGMGFILSYPKISVYSFHDIPQGSVWFAWRTWFVQVDFPWNPPEFPWISLNFHIIPAFSHSFPTISHDFPCSQHLGVSISMGVSMGIPK